MKLKQIYGVFLITSLLLLSVSISIAATGGQVDGGEGQRSNGTQSDTIVTEGGNITSINVSSTPTTSKWTGFYGNLKGTEILGDSAGNNFFKWTAGDPSGSFVYAVPSGSNTPDSNMENVSNPNSFLGGEFDSGTDMANDTFNQTSTFEGEGLGFNTSASYTFINSSFDSSGVFTTFLLNDSAPGNNPIYSTKVSSNEFAFKENLTVDYQLLAGVGEAVNTVTFNFYVELL